MKIKITKIEISEIEALQSIVLTFLNYKNATLKVSKDYFGDIMIIELLTGLYFNFRGKIENKKSVFCDFSVSPAQGVAILLACVEKQSASNEFQTYVAEKFKNLYHKALIDL